MSILVESLKRLFTTQKISIEKLNKISKNSKITQEEYNYIVMQ
jgi:hypothetical protein